MSIQAMKLALEALQYGYDAARCIAAFETIQKAEQALRAAIAEAEKCEPVAWEDAYGIVRHFDDTNGPASPLYAAPVVPVRTFQLGDRVTKTKGSSWTGKVVGFYSTKITPEGYAVESETEKGSVQIYPVGALASAPEYKP